jgi:hypothetical protein
MVMVHWPSEHIQISLASTKNMPTSLLFCWEHIGCNPTKLILTLTVSARFNGVQIVQGPHFFLHSQILPPSKMDKSLIQLKHVQKYA